MKNEKRRVGRYKKKMQYGTCSQEANSVGAETY